MGLLGKTLGFANKFKDRISQGILKAKDFVVNNSDQIGGALKAASPYIKAISPALGFVTENGGSILQNLKAGPVKDKLQKLTKSANDDTPKSVTIDSGAQQAVERRRHRQSFQPIGKRKRKMAKIATDE